MESLRSRFVFAFALASAVLISLGQTVSAQSSIGNDRLLQGAVTSAHVHRSRARAVVTGARSALVTAHPRAGGAVKHKTAPGCAAVSHNYQPAHHDRSWWRDHFRTIVFVNGGYYYLNAGFWFPAWGYDPLYNYYEYDGPIYTYGNLLPDQVVINVQRALAQVGYYSGGLTGSLSSSTRSAIAAYQYDAGLEITSVVDEPTVAALGLY
jgi:hypothetical protein